MQLYFTRPTSNNEQKIIILRDTDSNKSRSGIGY